MVFKPEITSLKVILALLTVGLDFDVSIVYSTSPMPYTPMAKTKKETPE